MNAQLSEVQEEFESALRRLHRLAETLPAEEWTRRVDPERWSAAECVEHLNLTSRAYLPLLREGVGEGRRRGGPAPRRYRRDPVGWLLWKTMGPPVRHRVATPAAFVPGAEAGKEALVRDFERMQEELTGLLRAADGLPLQKVRVRSPFAERMRYNLFSSFSIIPRHQHRHLWQAEQLRP